MTFTIYYSLQNKHTSSEFNHFAKCLKNGTICVEVMAVWCLLMNNINYFTDTDIWFILYLYLFSLYLLLNEFNIKDQFQALNSCVLFLAIDRSLQFHPTQRREIVQATSIQFLYIIICFVGIKPAEIIPNIT